MFSDLHYTWPPPYDFVTNRWIEVNHTQCQVLRFLYLTIHGCMCIMDVTLRLVFVIYYILFSLLFHKDSFSWNKGRQGCFIFKLFVKGGGQFNFSSLRKWSDFVFKKKWSDLGEENLCYKIINKVHHCACLCKKNVCII